MPILLMDVIIENAKTLEYQGKTSFVIINLAVDVMFKKNRSKYMG